MENQRKNLDTSTNFVQFEIVQDEKDIYNNICAKIDSLPTSGNNSPNVTQTFPIVEEMEFSLPLRTEQIEP